MSISSSGSHLVGRPGSKSGSRAFPSDISFNVYLQKMHLSLVKWIALSSFDHGLRIGLLQVFHGFVKNIIWVGAWHPGDGESWGRTSWEVETSPALWLTLLNQMDTFNWTFFFFLTKVGNLITFLSFCFVLPFFLTQNCLAVALQRPGDELTDVWV